MDQRCEPVFKKLLWSGSDCLVTLCRAINRAWLLTKHSWRMVGETYLSSTCWHTDPCIYNTQRDRKKHRGSRIQKETTELGTVSCEFLFMVSCLDEVLCHGNTAPWGQWANRIRSVKDSCQFKWINRRYLWRIPLKDISKCMWSI